MPKSSTSYKPGHSGNPTGRRANPYTQQLRDAMEEVAKKKGKSLLLHCVEEAYIEPGLATALMKKFLPDLKYIENDVNVSGGITLDHMDEDDLKSRIAELESLGTRRAVHPEERRTIKKSKR